MTRSQPVQSVVKAANILQLVGGSSDGMTLQQLAQAMQLKPPTVHHLARSLVGTGLLEKTQRPVRYRLGPALFELAHQRMAADLKKRVAAAMQRIVKAHSDATTVFGEALGNEIMVTLRMSPQQPGTLQRPSFQALSPYGSATGLVFQAFWNDEHRQQYQRHYPLEEYGPSWRSLKQFERFLAQSRKLGRVVRVKKNPATRQASVAVAAPVFGLGGELAGALGASLTADNAAADEVAQTLAGKVIQSAETVNESAAQRA